MVNNRYQLGDRLFSTSMGELYQARDMSPEAPARGHPEVLIHCLPSRTVGYTSVKRVLDYLQLKGQDIDSRLLPVLDGGWSGTEAFFVMRTPDSWSINSLPPAKGQPTSLHVKAIAMTADLVARKLIKQGLEPEFFLVTPGGDLHLLGTALAEELQSVKPMSATLLRPESLLAPRRSRWLSPLPLLLLTGVSVAGGLGAYYTWHKQGTLPHALETDASALAVQPLASVLDNPSPQPVDKGLPLALKETEDKTADKMEVMTEMVVTPEPNPTVQAEPKVEPTTISEPVLVEKPEPAVIPKPSVPAKEELEVAMLGQPATVVPAETASVEPAVSTEPEPLNEDPATLKLIERAENAIGNERLQTALYFIRLLRLSKPNHPQVTRLAGQVVTLYQQQAQDAVEDSASVGILRLSRSVIDDFSLPASFQRRQADLEQGSRR